MIRTPLRGMPARLAVGLIVVIGLGATLSACGNDGAALAKQACSHIDRSLKLLKESRQQADSATSAQLANQAYDQLRQALPIAAQAAYNDGQWQALMTTVSESNRVPEATLTSALQQQCQEADSSLFDQAPPPSSIPPPGSVPASP